MPMCTSLSPPFFFSLEKGLVIRPARRSVYLYFLLIVSIAYAQVVLWICAYCTYELLEVTFEIKAVNYVYYLYVFLLLLANAVTGIPVTEKPTFSI